MGRRPLTAAASQNILSQNILSHFAARDGRDRAARRKPLPRKRSALTVVGFEPRAGASITKKFSRAGASITKKVGSRWGRKAGGQTEGRWGRPLFPGWLFFSAVTKKTCRRREFLLSPGGLLFLLFLQATAVQRAASCPDERARASMWHAGPRIGDGYRKLSLTPTGVPNES